MLGWSCRKTGSQALRVLCIGAHCDDIEIGCGATLLALQRQYKKLQVDWLVLSGDAARRAEARAAMAAFVAAQARGRLLLTDFTDGFFPAQYANIKTYFESLKRQPRPDLIFCHER